MLVLELTLAVLILSRGRWAKLGIIGGILFLVGSFRWDSTCCRTCCSRRAWPSC
jgi:hypothetical protein